MADRLLLLILMASLSGSMACNGGKAPRPASLADLLAESSIVDLTHAFDADTIYWPTADGFKLTIEARGQNEKGYYYEANSFAAAEHGGTHLDAPSHFAEGQWRSDQIPVDRLIGPAVRIDVSAHCRDNPDYQVSAADIQAWEERNGVLPSGAIVLLHTGFGKLWPNPARYLGTEERGEEAVALLHFPGLAPDAASWIVENRSIRAIGLDTASIDFGQSTEYRSHRILFQADIPVFENVADPGLLPEKDFVVAALPMKIGGGSGGPLRIVAIVPRS